MNINFWRQYKHLTVFHDNEKAEFFIVYDTGITSFGPNKQFQKLNDAVQHFIPIASERLMTSLGYFEKTSDPVLLEEHIILVKKIISEQSFAKLEGRYFLARNCSTLKLLVGIEEKYLNDAFLNQYGLKETEETKSKKEEIINGGTFNRSELVSREPLFNGLKDALNTAAKTNSNQASSIVDNTKCTPDQILTNRKRIFDQGIYSSEALISSVKNITKLSQAQREEYQNNRNDKIKKEADQYYKEYTEPSETIHYLDGVLSTGDGTKLTSKYYNEIEKVNITFKETFGIDINSEEATGINSTAKNKIKEIENKAREEANELAIANNPPSMLGIGLAEPVSDWQKLLANKNDPRYKLIFEKKDYATAILGTFDYKVLLPDILKCIGSKLDPETLRNILSKFGNLKHIIDELLKWWFTDEICAPLLLNKIFDAFAFINIPYLPTYDPRANAFNIIDDFVKKLVTELTSLIIRYLLQQCTIDDLNANPNRPASQSFGNAIDDLFGDDSFDSFIDDDFAAGVNSSNPAENIREEIKDFIKDAIGILTDKELCNLLQGKNLSSEGYEVLESLMLRKYPDLVKYFNNRTKIHILFSKLDDIAKERGMPISICKDLEEQIDNLNKDKRPIYDIVCKTKKIDDLRKELLANKGLTPDEINKELDSISQDAAKNLEDFINAMNGNLDGLNNIPFFCRDRDITNSKLDGRPSTQLGQNQVTKDLLETTANTTFNKIYDTFDGEIKKWDGFSKFIESESNGKLVLTASGTIEFQQTDKNTRNETVEPKKTLDVAKVFKETLINQENRRTADIVSITVDHSELKKFDNLQDSALNDLFKQSKLAQFKKDFDLYRNAAFQAVGEKLGEKVNAYFYNGGSFFDIPGNGFDWFVEPFISSAKEMFNYSDLDDNMPVQIKQAEVLVRTIKNTERIIFNEFAMKFSTVSGQYLQLFENMTKSWEEYKKEIETSENLELVTIQKKIESLYPTYNLKYKDGNTFIVKNDNNFMSFADEKAFSLKERSNALNEILGNSYNVTEKDIAIGENRILAAMASSFYDSPYDYFETFTQEVGEDPKTKNKNMTSGSYLSELNLFIEKPSLIDFGCFYQRPNILNLDNIKARVLDIMQNDSCFAAPPKDPNEPKNNLNDYESAMISGLMLTFIRLNVLEVILKGIFPYSKYNIDEIENDLFIEFTTLFTEKEIKRFGNSFYVKFMDNLKNLYDKQKIVDEIKENDNYNLSSRQIMKLFVTNELRMHLEKGKKNNFRRLYDKFLEGNEKRKRKVKLETISVYDREYHLLSRYPHGSELKFIYRNGSIFIGSEEKKLTPEQDKKLKEVIFPLKNYLSILTITSALSSWSSRPQFNIFLQTKSKLRDSFEVITRGLNQKYGLETPRIEQMYAADTFSNFILEALLRTPINIFKAFCEGGDANISVASKIYMAGKIIEPDLPLLTLPVTSIGLMFYIFPTPFTFVYDAIVTTEGIMELAEMLNRKENEKNQVKNFVKGVKDKCLE